MHSLKSVLNGFVTLRNAPAQKGDGAGAGPLEASQIQQPEQARWGRHVSLPIAGQGAVAFEVGDFGATPPKSYSIRLLDEDYHDLFVVTVMDTSLAVDGFDEQGKKQAGATASFPEEVRLLEFTATSMFLWVSVDRANGVIRVGHGYMMRQNELLALRFPASDEAAHGRIKEVRSLLIERSVRLESAPKVSRMPVVLDAPPVVVDRDSLTLEQIARNEAISSAILPEEAQALYGTVSGRNIQLSAEDVAAINYSIETPGKCLYDILDKKVGEFGDSTMRYVRVTLGADEGNSPGVPYVLELWPKGCRSPVHDHGSTVAIIKVLHGNIHVRWFNPPAKEHNDALRCIKEQTFSAGDVTWITPEMYQTHQLSNPSSETMCATIQSYSYLDADSTHHEFFDWVSPPGTPEAGKLEYFAPNSDIGYLEMLATVREEYAERDVAPGLASVG